MEAARDLFTCCRRFGCLWFDRCGRLRARRRFGNSRNLFALSRLFCRRGFPTLHWRHRHLGIRSLRFSAYLFGLALVCGRRALLITSLSRFLGGSAVLFCALQRIFRVAQCALGVFDLELELIDLFFGNRIPGRRPACCLLHRKTPKEYRSQKSTTISAALAITDAGRSRYWHRRGRPVDLESGRCHNRWRLFPAICLDASGTPATQTFAPEVHRRPTRKPTNG